MRRKMENLRLFDRIRYGFLPAPGTAENARMAVESVVRHLRLLLNTQQGSTVIDPEYGMPEFADLRAEVPDSVSIIENMIRDVVARYEPRLHQVSVSYMYQDDQLVLHFQIRGVLDTKRGDLPVCLESIVDTCGKLDIKG